MKKNGKRTYQPRQKRVFFNKIKENYQLLGIIISICALSVTVWTVNKNDFSLRQLNRAWITVINLQMVQPLQENVSNQIAISFENSGKTPAVNVTFHSEALDFTGLNCSGPTVKAPYKSSMILGPAEKASNNNYVFLFPKECVAELQSGKANLYVRGSISYDDVFGEHHISRFCGQFEGVTTGLLTFCQNGNELQ